MKALLAAAVFLAFSCAGGAAYDASQAVRLEQGANPSVEGHSLGVVSVGNGEIALSIQGPDGEQKKVKLKKGEALTLGDSVYIVVKVEGNIAVIAPKKAEEPEDFGGNGDFGGGGGW